MSVSEVLDGLLVLLNRAKKGEWVWVGGHRFHASDVESLAATLGPELASSLGGF